MVINRILRTLLIRRKPAIMPGNEDSLRNYSLDLAQEWGDFWLKPIQGRLCKAYPHLTPQELDHYNEIAQAAMKYGHDLVYSMAESQGEKVSQSTWQANYSAHYPWVDKRNLSHLFSTGTYYAMKDGVGW